MNDQAQRATHFIAGLVAAGVRELAISPGSRSTPLALAAIAHPELHCHAVIDERAAAFFALGQAKATAKPSAALCSSGSAGAHYYPAIIEANQCFAPLVLITADRPPELHSTGAPQTIDQVKLFGQQVRGYFDLGVHDGDADSLRSVARKAQQAALLAVSPTPGPVHINAPARKPLEPTEQITVALWLPACPIPVATAPHPAGIELVAAACQRTRRGVIVCGPAPIAQREAREAVHELARRTGFPVLAEAASQLRFGGPPNLDRLDALPGGEPAELILQLGATPTSTAWRDYLIANPELPIIAVTAHGWSDPHNRATVVQAEPGALAAAVAARLPEPTAPATPTPWQQRWLAANDRAWRQPISAEGAIARAVVDALPEGSLLALGNSTPLRTVDRYCPATAKQLAVWSQRGANGIDGLISGVAGAASVWQQPAALLLGDVSFAHDLGGLALARTVTTPLAIVVIDNGGGRIFEQLPIAKATSPQAFDRHWLTPPRIDIPQLCAAFGVPCTNLGKLDAALQRPGPTVIYAEVPG